MSRSDKAQRLFEDVLKISEEIRVLQKKLTKAEAKYHQQLNDEQGLGPYHHPALRRKRK